MRRMNIVSHPRKWWRAVCPIKQKFVLVLTRRASASI